MMRRVWIAATAAFGGAICPVAPAEATTLIVYADPMTFEARKVVIDPSGPDRTYLCLMPPSQAGCHEVKRVKP